MFLHYLKIAVRNIRNHFTISLINIFGLAIGLVATLLIVLYVANELSYDRFHSKGQNIVKVEFNHKDGDQTYSIPWMSYGFGEAVKESCPEVQDFARITDNSFNSRLVQSDPAHKNYEANFLNADNGFLRLFNFKLVKGDPKTALTRPNTVLLTESMAAKYFGNNDPIGKTITYDKQYTYEVVGILKDLPSNSSLKFDFLGDIESYRSNEKKNWTGYMDEKQQKEQLTNVGASGLYNTFLLLNDHASLNKVAKKIPSVLSPTSVIRDKKDSYDLFPLYDLHFSHFSRAAKPKVIVFSIIGIMILSLALINYINLTTARSTVRATEVSIRKIVGAARKALVFQFYLESVLYVSLAFLLAVLLFFVVQKHFYQTLDLKIDTVFLTSLWFILPVITLFILSIFLSGSYPAFLLSGFAPIRILKGRLGIKGGAANLRKLFTVFQFTVSIALIIGSILIAKQMTLFQEKDLGISRDRIITVFLDEEDGLDKHYKEIRNELNGISGVEAVTSSSLIMYYPYGNSFDIKRFDNDKKIQVSTFRVDDKFVETMNIKWAISPQKQTNLAGKDQIILNEAAAKELAINASNYNQTLDLGYTMKRDLIGVVKDLNYTSLVAKIKPMAFLVNSDTLFNSYLYIKLAKNADVKKTLANVQQVYDRYKINRPFEYSFLDETYNQMYKDQRNTGQVVYTFTSFAILIACLGLFGLTVFTAEQRKKEIGIRKVLGATMMNILSLLSKEYVMLVIISILIASPIAYYGMNKWLADFAYRIDIHWSVFTVAGVLAIVITLITVSFQGIKAATTNPVKSLRSE